MPPKTPAIETKKITLAEAPAVPADAAANTAAEVAKKLEVIAAENKAAKAELETHFGKERWPLLMKQAAERRFTPEDVERLCGNLRRSRKEWVMAQGNDKAAFLLAANALLVAVGSAPAKADREALEKALSEAPAAA